MNGKACDARNTTEFTVHLKCLNYINITCYIARPLSVQAENMTFAIVKKISFSLCQGTIRFEQLYSLKYHFHKHHSFSVALTTLFYIFGLNKLKESSQEQLKKNTEVSSHSGEHTVFV